MRDPSISDIAALLNQHIADLACAILGEPNRALSSRTQLRYGRKGSIAIEVAGERQGRWYDHERGVGGDGLALIKHQLGHDHPKALGWARDWLGRPSHPPARPQSDTAPPRPTRYETLSSYGRELWAASRVIRLEAAAGRYLIDRGCALPHPDGDLRWGTRAVTSARRWWRSSLMFATPSDG
jgi:hypothetical protein